MCVCVCVCVCVYNVDLKYLYNHILLFTNRFMKKKKNFKLSLLFKLWNNEDSNAFLVKLLHLNVFKNMFM
jgi:hypothetical protein